MGHGGGPNDGYDNGVAGAVSGCNCLSQPRQGFMSAMKLTLRGIEGALLHAGPPCSSFVWCNRGTTHRTRDNVEGDGRQPTVRTANVCLDVGALVYELSHAASKSRGQQLMQ